MSVSVHECFVLAARFCLWHQEALCVSLCDDAPRLPAMSVNVCTAGRNYPPAPLRLPPVLPQPPEVYFGHPQYAAVGNLFWPSAWQGQVKDSAYEMHGLKPGATKVWERFILYGERQPWWWGGESLVVRRSSCM